MVFSRGFCHQVTIAVLLYLMPLYLFVLMMLFAVILYAKLSHGRAFLKEHSNAGTFVDQHIAAGAFSRRLAQIYENYFGDDK